MESPGGGAGIDATILHGGNLGRSTRTNHTLRITIEEG